MDDFFNSKETENTQAALFSDENFDEMQKALNYEIGFKLFRIMFFITLIGSVMMFIISDGTSELPLMVMSFILFAASMVIYILYAAMTSAKGVMNPTFAKNCSGNWQIPVWVIFSIVSIILFFCELLNLSQVIMYVTAAVSNCIICFFARRNMKVLKKQLKEDDVE